MTLDVGLKLTEVGDMDNFLRACDTPKWCVRRWPNRSVALACFDIRGRRVVSSGNRAEGVAIPEVQNCKPSFANACRIRQHNLEHWLKLRSEERRVGKEG